MVSSVIGGGSFAKATVCRRRTASKANAILYIIFSGHCTPVESIEKGAIGAPSGLHVDVQIQIYLGIEEALHFMARLGADEFQHRAAGADDDCLLPLALQVNRGVNAGDLRRLLPPVDGDGD